MGGVLRLVRLELENWRGFEHLELQLEPDLTVLIGENGSGKTAVLEALARMLGLIGGVSGGGGGYPPAHVLRVGASELTLRLDIEDAGEDHTYSLTAPDWRAFKQGDDSQWLLKRLQARGAPRPIAVHYRTNRWAMDLTPADPSQGARNADVALVPNQPQDAIRYAELFHWFRDREDLENEHIRDDPSFRDTGLEAVRSAFSSLIPGLDDPRIRRGEVVADKPKPMLTLQKDGQRLVFDALSDGERNLLCLGADIARRLTEAGTSSGVVLVDEIDAHLHPRLQREIVGRLRTTFPDVQWVLATHSPLVAMHVESRCIRLLEQFALVPAPLTEGRNAASLLLELFRVSPEHEDTRTQLHQIAVLMDSGDTDQARKKLDGLAARLGDDDEDVIRNRTLLDLMAVGL